MMTEAHVDSQIDHLKSRALSKHHADNVLTDTVQVLPSPWRS